MQTRLTSTAVAVAIASFCFCGVQPVRAEPPAEGDPAAVARAKSDAFLAARKKGDFEAMARMAAEGKPPHDALSPHQVTQEEESRLHIDGLPISSRFITAIAQPFGAWTFVYVTGFSKGREAQEQVVTERRSGVTSVSGYTSVPCVAASCAAGEDVAR